MDRRYGVMQFVAVVQNSDGMRFMVFRSGDPKYYLFSQLLPGPGLVASGLQWPVLKSRLREDIKRALANGWGNAGPIPDAPKPTKQFAEWGWAL